MAMKYQAVDNSNPSFFERLLQTLLVSGGTALAQGGVQGALGNYFDKRQKVDDRQAAAEQNALGSEDRLLAAKQGILAKSLADLPAQEQGRILLENYTDPEMAHNQNFAWEKGPQLPKDKVAPTREQSTSPQFNGPVTDEEKARQFYWQSKGQQNEMGSMPNQVLGNPVDDATGTPQEKVRMFDPGRSVKIRTGTSLQRGAEENPAAYDWAKKGDKQHASDQKPFLEQLKAGYRSQLKDRELAAKSQEKGLDRQQGQQKIDNEEDYREKWLAIQKNRIAVMNKRAENAGIRNDPQWVVAVESYKAATAGARDLKASFLQPERTEKESLALENLNNVARALAERDGKAPIVLTGDEENILDGGTRSAEAPAVTLPKTPEEAGAMLDAAADRRKVKRLEGPDRQAQIYKLLRR